MESPVFLTKATVLRMQQRQIEQFGGGSGVRDEALLESALALPNNVGYTHEVCIKLLRNIACH